ncbi:hypothetical protein B296_00028410 [Ensete ventricosum]|uniref:Uncharacterized protein n=1 Tax=Ensete ventricosum TaxID=4639 RepID=A0A426X946_ENSVE|nr:hypothetical protein B296_00028410 [Ensete ventricosum]
MASQRATLVLRTSWFNCSSWIHVKEIAAIRLWKVEARIIAIVRIAWEGGGMDGGYRGSKIAALIPDDRSPDGAL